MLPLPRIGETVLGIDPGTALGWALYTPNGNDPPIVKSGIHTLPVGKRKGLRWESLRLFLAQTHAKQPIDVLAFEHSTWKRNALAMLDHGGVVAIIQWWAFKHAVRLETATPKQIKLHATGHGGAGKKLVMDSMALRGYNVTDDNEADALAMLDLVIWRLHSKRRAA